MKLSAQLFPEKYSVPEQWQSTQTYKLLEQSGFVYFPHSGYPLFLPIGQRVIERICSIIRAESEKFGYDEVYLPLIQESKLLEETGRADIFSKELFRIAGNNDRYILAATNEEVFLDLASKGLVSYRQLPVRWYQIADKFRNVKKAKGILRSRQFLMCDMVSIDANENSLWESARLFEYLVYAVCSEFDMHPLRVSKDNEKYVDFLIPCDEGEVKINIDVDERRTSYATNNDLNSTNSSGIAMYFIFDQTNIIRNISYQSIDANLKKVYLGSYGFGIQRCMHAIVETHRDKLGILFPKNRVVAI